MDTFDKIKWLIDKQCGFGLPLSTVARYCGVHPSTLNFYIKSDGPAKLDTLDRYTAGVEHLVEDFKKNMID